MVMNAILHNRNPLRILLCTLPVTAVSYICYCTTHYNIRTSLTTAYTTITSITCTPLLSFLLHYTLSSLTSSTTITPLPLTPLLPTALYPLPLSPLVPLLLHYRLHLSFLLHYIPFPLTSSTTITPLPLTPLLPTALYPLPLLDHYYSITANTSPTYCTIPLTSLTSITYTPLSYLHIFIYCDSYMKPIQPSYGQPLVPWHPDKGGSTVLSEVDMGSTLWVTPGPQSPHQRKGLITLSFLCINIIIKSVVVHLEHAQ